MGLDTHPETTASVQRGFGTRREAEDWASSMGGGLARKPEYPGDSWSVRYVKPFEAPKIRFNTVPVQDLEDIDRIAGNIPAYDYTEIDPLSELHQIQIPDALGQLSNVQAIRDRQFRNFGQPAIEAATGGGPRGEGFDSASRARAVGGAQTALAAQSAGERFQAFEQQRRDQLWAENINVTNRLNMHYANQEGKLLEFKTGLMRIESALQQAGFVINQQQFNATGEYNESLMNAQSVQNTRAMNVQRQQFFARQVADEQIRRNAGGGGSSGLGTIAGMAIGLGAAAFTGGTSLAALSSGASIGGSLGGGIEGSLSSGSFAPMAASLSQLPGQVYNANEMIGASGGWSAGGGGGFNNNFANLQGQYSQGNLTPTQASQMAMLMMGEVTNTGYSGPGVGTRGGTNYDSPRPNLGDWLSP